mmetsp:Transcript_55524/g.132720  ORF Transcript_55524/g.132720 Transcript_55524/m.132720 type:complete len:245 (-) Transcript_55524:359-1093(-)
MSPLRWVPLDRFFSTPPSICKSRPAFTRSWPQMAGAKDLDSSWKASSLSAIFLMLVTSWCTKTGCTRSRMGLMLVATSLAGNTPSVNSCMGGGKERYTPMTCTRSPGFALSQSSPSQITLMLLGICPGGAVSGVSWMVKCWESLYMLNAGSIFKSLPSLSCFGKPALFKTLLTKLVVSRWSRCSTYPSSVFLCTCMEYSSLGCVTRHRVTRPSKHMSLPVLAAVMPLGVTWLRPNAPWTSSRSG